MNARPLLSRNGRLIYQPQQSASSLVTSGEEISLHLVRQFMHSQSVDQHGTVHLE